MPTRASRPPDYTHFTLECRGCPPALLNDRRTILKALRTAAKACRLHIVQEGTHRFQPHGITGYVLLEESHISVHTWPQSRFALVDVLSCTDVESKTVIACIRRLLSPTRVVVRAQADGTASMKART